ncbi:MAG: hypothetical protein ABEK16_04565 [Candidatus Nanohalobium sp.]
MATSSGTDGWVSHDGAEERLDYEDEEVVVPDSLTAIFDQIEENGRVGHGLGRQRYAASGEMPRGDTLEDLEFEADVTETVEGGYRIRATVQGAEGAVYTAEIDVDSELDEKEKIFEYLSEAELERIY